LRLTPAHTGESCIACLKRKFNWLRAEALINIAHPDFRDVLVGETEKMEIWKNSRHIGT
jgi:acyl-CoA hydrolase